MTTPPASDPIVLILRHFTVGGLERVLLSHVRLLLSAGYDTTVCVLDPGRDNALVAELPPGVRLVTAPRSRLHRIAFLHALVRDATVLLQFGDGRLYPSIRPALGSARTVIRFCHSDYSHLRTKAKNLLDRVLSRGEDRIIAVGGRSTRFLLDDVGVSASKVTTLINAIEPRPTRPSAPSWSWAQDPYLVAVQSLYPHKGHDALLKAFAQVVRQHPGPIRLVIIGDGDQTIALRRLADTLDVADDVVWLGGLWQKDIVDTVLAHAVAFVSMSRFEGVPISVLEARQYGLPLVLTDIPGHRDGAGTSPVSFPAVDEIGAFARQVLQLLETRGEAPQPAACDADGLAQDWHRYSAAFLSVLARAATEPTSTATRA